MDNSFFFRFKIRPVPGSRNQTERTLENKRNANQPIVTQHADNQSEVGTSHKGGK